MFFTEMLVTAADLFRKSPIFEWVARSDFFVTLKEEVLRAFLVDVAGMPVDMGIRPILRLRQSRMMPKIIQDKAPSDPDLRVLLVQPPLPSNNRNKVLIPYGLVSIAAQIRKQFPKVQVGILDALVHSLPLKSTLEHCLQEHWDIIGISAMTCQAPFAFELAKEIKQAKPAASLILGGVHPTLSPDEALTYADLVVIGEGEETMLEVVQHALQHTPLENIPGTAWKTNGAVRLGPPRSLIRELDGLEFPAYDLIPIHMYNNPLHVVGGERLPLFASRGCPFSCSFCNSPQIWHQRVRFRSAGSVLKEVDWIMKTFQVRQFHFWDDNIGIKPELLKEICHGFIERKNIRWVALDRAESIVKMADMLPLLKEAGCVGIELGVESVNPDTFSYIKKGQGFDDCRKAVEFQKNAGLAPLYTCMAFNPGETISGYRYQKLFLDQIQEGLPWYAFFHPLPFPIYLGQFATPYPETPFHKALPTLGEDLAERYDQKLHHFINFVPHSLLEDRPLLSRKPKRTDRAMLCVVAMAGMFDWFDGSSTIQVAAQRMKDFVTIYHSFFPMCQGQKSVCEIAGLIEHGTGITHKKVVQALALICYIYGQTGHLSSAGVLVPDSEIAPALKIPHFSRRLLKRLEHAGDFVI
ncbi:MAG: B12-binding domain-containing radical SAM protein [Candidatus Riflebacteria bacterium]|nr:B12-binding domain-containing radical SAM protein [Candidatus Riflebacteria bacterium]